MYFMNIAPLHNIVASVICNKEQALAVAMQLAVGLGLFS